MHTFFIVFTLLALLLVGCRRERDVLRRRNAARERLRERFTHFVGANRHRSVTEGEIERFLRDTAEVNALFGGTALPSVRLELHDHALRLCRLCVAVEEGWGGAGERERLVEGCEEWRAWFARVAPSIDPLFEEGRSAPLERFNRVIRA